MFLLMYVARRTRMRTRTFLYRIARSPRFSAKRNSGDLRRCFRARGIDGWQIENKGFAPPFRRKSRRGQNDGSRSFFLGRDKIGGALRRPIPGGHEVEDLQAIAPASRRALQVSRAVRGPSDLNL